MKTFLMGGVFGIIMGYVMASIMKLSSKDAEIDNLLSYIDELEVRNDQLREELKETKNLI